MDSNLEWLIEALLNGESVADFTPKSRMEEYLKAILSKSGTDNLPIPRSRIDALLYQLVQSGEIGTLPLQTKTVTPTLEAQTVTADAGYALYKVNVEAATDVYDAGIQAERKAMWDVLQQNGKRTDYSAMFAYSRYGGKNFYPQYDIKPTTIANWFYSANNPDYCGSLNFGERLRECGITLDTSNCTNFRYAFNSATNLRGDFGTLDIRKNTDVTGIIGAAGSSAVNNNAIKFIVDENTNLKDMFASTGNRHWIITFEGTIGQSLNLSSTSRLDTECAKTIITTNLKNLAGTDLEGTLSFKLHSDVWTALDTTYPREDGNTWNEYVISSLGWTT